MAYISMQFCLRVFIKSFLFQLTTLGVIVFNSFCLAFELTGYDSFFQAFFTFEVSIKILAWGLILRTNAYFRDFWNVLDFVVLLISYIPFVGTRNLNALRTFQVLKFLDAAQSIKPLRSILQSLFQSRT